MYNGAEKNPNLNKNQKQTKKPHSSQGLVLCTKKELHLDSSAVLAGQTSHTATLAFHPVTPLIMELV